jgi:hypothetical protein
VVLDFPDRDFLARAERIKGNLNGRYDWEGWRTGKRESLRVQDAWVFDEDVKSIALNPRILEILSALYGRRGAIPRGHAKLSAINLLQAGSFDWSSRR